MVNASLTRPPNVIDRHPQQQWKTTNDNHLDSGYVCYLNKWKKWADVKKIAKVPIKMFWKLNVDCQIWFTIVSPAILKFSKPKPFSGPLFFCHLQKGGITHNIFANDFKMATYILWKNSRRITSEVAPLLNTAKKSPLPGSVIVWNEWRLRTLVCFVLWQKSKWIIMFLKRPVGRKISKCSTLYF